MEEKETQGLRGLTGAEVAERVAAGKVNGDQDIKTKSVGKILATNIFTFFNGIFAVIAVILGVLLLVTKKGRYEISDFSDFGFLGVLVVNTLIGIVQELKAKRTIDKLSLLSAPKVTVLRDGEEKDILLKEIVSDDVVLLSGGRQICADSVVAEGYLEVNESIITGEPDAIPKNVGDELLSGSFVVSGTAKARVIRVGKENYATKISAGAKYVKDFPSEIRRTLLKFIRVMGIVIIPVGVALFCVKHFLHGNAVEPTVQSVMGTLIGMIPSGLVTLTSAVFCVSVVRLSKHKALAQDLYCVDTLARVDTLCLDKTGTLTEGSMMVEHVVPKKAGVPIDAVLRTVVEETGDDNVTARAVREYASNAKRIEGEKTDVIPFSSKYKFSGYGTEEGYFLLGAPEFLLRERLVDVKEELEAYSEKGMRVLALVRAKSVEENAVKGDVELLALVVISDKIRKEAPDTLRFFDEQGVNILIISGDNPVTVSKIAERAGVKNYDKYVDASTLTTEEELEDALKKYAVFGRTTPDQKLSLVKLLRKNGHTVAMTGDGVNDVLALRESDCSVAMASGSDAAKNVSQLVLLDSNFASMPKAVAEGRRTINNLERSASLYLVKTIYNLLFALIFLFIPYDLPFLPRHMTFIGALTIGIPSVVLALEPNKEIVKGHFFRKVLGNALPASLTVVVCIVTATLASRAFPEMDQVQLSTVCTCVAGFVGFVYVGKISYPFNVWRVTLVTCLAGTFVAAFFARFSFFNAPQFFGLTERFTRPMFILLGGICGGCVPIFVGLCFLTDFINKKLANKRIRLLDAFESEGEK